MTTVVLFLAVAVLAYCAGLSYDAFKRMTKQEKIQGFSVAAFTFMLIVVEGLLNG